ncbi:unnamed protein product [Eruca vesicaria subsp. sativa]|uniref:Peptidase A1 domain-containing protein n=1 Tax=Eruca vesicaria subsp. sativa TaxID=29727 RepID=A0ABC8LY56_ERUVS|nr:unnamed protein product [Eruca vesicaria subsp. sativa]
MPPITIFLRSHSNQAYSGLMEFGGGLFDVSFNTGMHGIWVPGRIRIGITPRGRFRYLADQTNFYDESDESDTYDEAPGTETSIRWRSGDVTIYGSRRTDEMTLGSGYTVTFCRGFVIYDIVDPVQFYMGTMYDGFVGLRSPPPGNTDPSDLPIWRTMMSRGLLPSSQFSLYLRYNDSDDTNGGSITFGGVDRDNYIGHHQYFDLVQNSYEWKIHMYSVAVAGHLPQYCQKVLIDSGSKYIYGPPHIIHAINRQICGRQVPLHGPTVLTDGERETLSQGPDVTFNFNEDCGLTIGPADYVIFDEDEQDYTTAFRHLVFQPGEETYFVLGIPWLLRYHTIFDFRERRIGFARSVQ